MRISKLADGISTSPIITLAAEINQRIQAGEEFYNLTIGDFNPNIFPIPTELRDGIIQAYHENHTNYPGAFGMLNLRESVSVFLKDMGEIDIEPNDILVSSGSRPLIYSFYRSVVDPGDKVVFPVPSWNNDYYTHLTFAKPVLVETTPETNFMPTAEELAPHLRDARLLVLCSPLNPTGTVIPEDSLQDICNLVLEENRRRSESEGPLYILFDQIYWLLTFGQTKHHNALNISPEMRDYTVYIDGLSKAFAGTGIRCGWAFGASDIMAKMRTIVAHIGAWAPKAEQVAAGHYLADLDMTKRNLDAFKGEVQARLNGFYKGFCALRDKGYRVNAIEPQAAIYLTVQLDLKGIKTSSGTMLASNEQVHRYILDEARVGLVPFSYFGASPESSWYRLSVGTCKLEEVEVVISNLDSALGKLSE